MFLVHTHTHFSAAITGATAAASHATVAILLCYSESEEARVCVNQQHKTTFIQ